jgi:LPXTG-motif cell wall-anchored protein
LRDEYKGLGVTLDDVTSSDDWASKAEIMSAQLIGSGIEPMTASTNDDDKAVFENLSFGIYLVVADECMDETDKYTIAPNFISVPNSTDGDTWIYDVSASVKYEKQEITPTPKRYRVTKSWAGDGAGETRPEEVQVTIYNRVSGAEEWTEVETVSLNSGNNWTHEWSSDVDGVEWSVKELLEDENYTITNLEPVTDENGEVCFMLMNKYVPTVTPTPTDTPTPTPEEPTETPTPEPTGTPSPVPTTSPRPTVTTRPTVTPRVTITRAAGKATATPRPNVTTTVNHTTPKTGDDQNILLPIIGVLAAGLVLVLLGLNLRKKSGKDEE